MIDFFSKKDNVFANELKEKSTSIRTKNFSKISENNVYASSFKFLYNSTFFEDFIFQFLY